MIVKSFGSTILYGFIKLAQLCLLNFIVLSIDQCLSIDAITHLLLELLNRCLHPMIILCGWFNALY